MGDKIIFIIMVVLLALITGYFIHSAFIPTIPDDSDNFSIPTIIEEEDADINWENVSIAESTKPLEVLVFVEDAKKNTAIMTFSSDRKLSIVNYSCSDVSTISGWEEYEYFKMFGCIICELAKSKLVINAIKEKYNINIECENVQ